MRSWFEVEVVIWGYQRPNNWLSRSNQISMVTPRSDAFWLIMLSHPILKYIHKTITTKYFRFRLAYLLSVFFLWQLWTQINFSCWHIPKMGNRKFLRSKRHCIIVVRFFDIAYLYPQQIHIHDHDVHWWLFYVRACFVFLFG